MISYYSTVSLSFCIIFFLIKLLRNHFYFLAESSLSLVDTLLLKINEDEKVKLVQKQNNILLLALGKVLISLVIAISLGSIPIIVYVYLQHLHISEIELSSIPSIIALSVGSTIGFLIPTKKNSDKSYSELSQLLHRIALNNYSIASRLFKLEEKRIKKSKINQKKEFIIISGLARAGTTSLMNKLSENKTFSTLNYGNMPFITAPRIWSKFYSPKNNKTKERSHKDGILIGLKSNEALEEYFFKVLANDEYVTEDTLNKYYLTEKDHSEYLNYQRIIRNSNQNIYLAKNNNFAIRYDSLRKYNKDFVVVFMYRDPLIHAASLFEKHKEFTNLQNEDPFVLEYMNWLGHHEFGNNQKPFQFNENKVKYIEDKSSINYWLQIWINYYSYLLTIDKTKALFIDYSTYCQSPNNTIEKIYKSLEIEAPEINITPFTNKRKAEYIFSKDLKEKAYEIYNNLKSLN